MVAFQVLGDFTNMSSAQYASYTLAFRALARRSDDHALGYVAPHKVVHEEIMT